MMFDQSQVAAASECLRKARDLMARSANEEVIRHNFSSYIYLMFPERPRWAQLHIEGGEAGAVFGRDGAAHRGFVDNLVDATAIEYEPNLDVRSRFAGGLGQVKDYCASLLNRGREQAIVVGILSDTVRWHAYRIASVSWPTSGPLGRDDIELDEIDSVDGTAADESAARNLLTFLVRYVGRLGGRNLSAASIAHDLGFDSEAGLVHVETARRLVQHAFEVNAAYGQLMEELWKRFVTFVGAPESAEAFSRDGYADELYLLTLAKLVCANVLERRSLVGGRADVESILTGDFFRMRGLNNVVEYDYFGWLHREPLIDTILSVAMDIQDDLRAYDFASAPADDLFGELMVQLAKRAQRLLLGQALTPRWLARELARRVIDALPHGEMPRMVDMCCGSGAIVVEAVLHSKERIAASIPEGDQARRVQELTLAITGFDIDPIAVILAKVGWILAARDWLEPLGAFPVSIPIYHADSLFAITPLSRIVDDEGDQGPFALQIAHSTLELPRFLVSPAFQAAFDAIVDAGYELAMSGGGRPVELPDDALETAARRSLAEATRRATLSEHQEAKAFLEKFATTVDRLNRDGQNGIWAFILRNSYRPGLVAGQFNGLISNPPWLALSRIADNPYRVVLRQKAEQFGVRPPGPSFLHIEMSTIFLLHAVRRYLRADARVGCIVPDSVLTGYNHNPFRNSDYRRALRPVDFRVEEIWRIPETAFKNRGAVLVGSKSMPAGVREPATLPGFLVDESGMIPLTIYRNVQGPRSAWSEHATPAGETGFFNPATFRQGADIMPRTLFFHELRSVPPSRGRVQWDVRPIDQQSSPLAFVVRDAKKLRDFRLRPCVLPDELFYNVLTSNLLTPFDLARPLRALLPMRRGGAGWVPLTRGDIAAMGPASAAALRQICSAIGAGASVTDVWNLLDTRGKLSQQRIEASGYLVLTGTSGEVVCSAYASTDSLGPDRLVIDQTLNWARVDTLDEATYLSGLLNSEAINLVIRDFQPEGAFGRRHIHSLPFRATPPFDPSQALHQDVVAQTRLLVDQYEAAKAADRQLRSALDPNTSSLARRRSVITAKVRALPAYGTYAMVCRDLYGV